ncbi:MAG TPA: hypothetical protein VFR88_09515, partial [Microlunatus sp.]|nr:hypothetical protein [Microlunatus sp.]
VDVVGAEEVPDGVPVSGTGDAPITRVRFHLDPDQGDRRADLAAELGRERDDWKRDVRKLKALGLTESLEVGYRLSPRGRAFLAADRA